VFLIVISFELAYQYLNNLLNYSYQTLFSVLVCLCVGECSLMKKLYEIGHIIKNINITSLASYTLVIHQKIWLSCKFDNSG